MADRCRFPVRSSACARAPRFECAFATASPTASRCTASIHVPALRRAGVGGHHHRFRRRRARFSLPAGRPGTLITTGAATDSRRRRSRCRVAARDWQLVGALIVDRAEAPDGEDRVLRDQQLEAGQGPACHRQDGHQRAIVAAHRTARLSRRRHGAHAADQCAAARCTRCICTASTSTSTAAATSARHGIPAGSSPRMVVTERLPAGRTFSLTWKPTRPGNWLFHCHDNVHLRTRHPARRRRAARAAQSSRRQTMRSR